MRKYEEISCVPRCKFLGDILDRKLNWKPCCEILRDKSLSTLNEIIPRRYSGPQTELEATLRNIDR